MQQGLKQVSKYGFGIMALAALFLLVVFLLHPYASLQESFQQFNADKETLFPWNDYAGTYGFSESTYWLAVVGYAAIFGLGLLAFFRVGRNPNAMPVELKTGIIMCCWQKLKNSWQKLPVWERWLLAGFGVLLTAVRTYFLFTSRIGGDEAASYIFFIDKGLPGILFYYPLPNNHIFYNLLCLPFRVVFTDPFWTVELPTYLLSAFGTALVYLAYRTILPFWVAFFGIGAFYFSQYAIYYSVHGRGYFVVSICAALAALALYKLHEQKNYFYWLVFLVASIMGFYTIPIFLLPFAGLLAFGFYSLTVRRNFEKVKELLLACSFIGVNTALLYSPVLLATGAKLLLGNRYISAKPFADYSAGFSFLFTYTQGSVVGQETYGFYLWLMGFLGISGLLLFQKPLKSYLQQLNLTPVFLLLIWFCLWVPWVVLFVQRVRPPERVLFYKGFFDLLAIGMVAYAAVFYLWRRFSRVSVAGLVVFLLGFGAYQATKVVRNDQVPVLMSPGFDARLQQIVKSGARTIYANELYYSANLRYELFKNRPEGFMLSEFLFDPKYDYEVAILDKKGPPPPEIDLGKFQVFYEDTFVKILFRKGFKPKSN